MPRIKCHYVDCVFLDDSYCSAAAVEIDPDSGCATYSPSDAVAGGQWQEEEESEWEDEESEDGDDDLWDDEDEDEI